MRFFIFFSLEIMKLHLSYVIVTSFNDKILL